MTTLKLSLILEKHLVTLFAPLTPCYLFLALKTNKSGISYTKNGRSATKPITLFSSPPSLLSDQFVLVSVTFNHFS
jgi:hypothetical protein